MGQQNITYFNQDNIQQKYQVLSEDYAKRKIIYTHYRVGGDVEKDRWMHAYLMQETLCTTNCEIVDYIWMKINGELDDCTNDIAPMDINVMQETLNITDVNECITEQCGWDNIQW